MKVLMFGTDQNVWDAQSETYERMHAYGALVEELHIVIYTQSKKARKKEKIRDNVIAYPTNNRSKLGYITKAYVISVNILARYPDKKNWIITTQDPFEMGVVGYAVKKKYHVPLQVQLHTDMMSEAFKKESFKNRYRVWLGKKILRRADCIRVVSHHIRESLIKEMRGIEQKITVLPIAIEESRKEGKSENDLRKQYPAHDKIILMASRLTKEKNITLAVEAMEEVVKKEPNILLVIVGEGSEKEKIKKQIINKKLESNIVVKPWTNDMDSYYGSTDIFLITSNYEGYGRTIIEARRRGLPVITTEVGIAREVSEKDQGTKVIPINNKEKLTEAIRNTAKEKIPAPIGIAPTKEEFLKKQKEYWEKCNERIQNSSNE
jgi:glycosyltransferase involved in cell wall biosynthesis